MQYNQPFGISDPNAPYINGNPSTGTMGSIPPAASIEFDQREIVNMISLSGLTPTNSDLQQLAKAVQAGRVTYALDSGPVNTLIVNLNPALTVYPDGLAVWIIPQFANTGPATLNLNGLGARNIVRRGGDPLSAGDMPGGYKSLVTFNALHNNFELYGVGWTVAGGGGGGPGFLPILLANTTWYVNASIGSDTLYDGTQPTISGPHGPFKTIGKAVSVVYTYGPSVYTATIQIAAGTYNETVSTPLVIGPTTHFVGAGPSTIVNNTTSNTFEIQGPNIVQIEAMRVNAPTIPSGNSVALFAAYNGAQIRVKNCVWGGVAQGWGTLCNNANIRVDVGNSIVGNMSVVLLSLNGGLVAVQPFVALTISNAILVPTAFADAYTNGIISAPASSVTFPGAGNVTGPKYVADLNGAIDTTGGGASFFPGTTAGAVARGGQYG